jgi:pyruvate/2-oxoglutarate dehydrogenase complex dihydrolipoamide acyltransferase (E2) component
VIEGQIVPREILNLTVTFDHEVIDGAPAVRFTRRLVELIECGYGLDEIVDKDDIQPVEGESVHAR